MYDIVICPQCKRRLKVPDEHAGGQVKCPQCSTTFSADAKPSTAEAVSAAPIAAAPTPEQESPEPLEIDTPAPASKPRKARLHSQPRPASRSKLAICIILGVAGILAAGGISWLLRLSHHPGPVRLAFQPEDPVPAGPLPAMNPEQNLKDMKEFFQNFSRAIRARDMAAVAISFDTKRTIEELAQHKHFPENLRGDRRFESQLNQSFAQSILQNEAHWANHDVRHIHVTGEQELVVITRHRNKMLGGTTRFRWWMTSRRGNWRIYDLEDLDLSMRVSFVMGAIVEHGLQNLNAQPMQDLLALKDATQALVVRQDLVEADRQLSKSNVANLPKALAGAHHFLRGIIRLRQQRIEDCLAACDDALRSHPDMPGVDYVKAIAYNNLKRHDQALIHARKYHDLVGDDPEICFEHGYALHELLRFKEAAIQYRRALDEDPSHHDAFLSLLRCIGGDQGTHNLDIAERFLKQERPQDTFEQYAQDRRTEKDASTLEMLALAMRKVEPGHADAAHYLALARAELRKTDEAVEAFRGALELQKAPARREFYIAEFARTLSDQGKILESYPKLPESRLVFRSAALALKNAFRLDELEDLIDLHAAKHADDAFLTLYQAELHARDEQFDLAEKAYATALTKVNDAQLLDAFRSSRVVVKYRTGDVLGAYRQIGPPRAAFLQLADLCWHDKKNDDLVALVEAHAKNDPQDPMLVRQRWRAEIRQGKIDEAAALMKAALATKKDANDSKRLNDDFLFDLIDSDQAVAAYRHAADPADALNLLITDLLETGKLEQLRAVSDAHRKRFPNDPLASICAGEIALAEKKWDQAAQAFAEAWKTLPDAQKARWQHSYAVARYKAGQALQAYQDGGRKVEIFRDLARRCLADKNADLFEQLLEAHRPQRKDDPHFDAYEARLRVIRGKLDEASELFARCWMSVPEPQRPALHADFIDTLADWHPKGLTAYACALDKRAAFQSLAWRFRNPKQVEDFDRLIQEHAKNDPNDPRLLAERAELHLLRGELALAEKHFILARDKGSPNDTHFIRMGLFRTRVLLGKVAETYRELGTGNQAFLDLANKCVQEKNAEQLQALLEAHRLAVPKFKNAAVWELEICWLKKDYDGAIARIRADGGRLLTNPTTRWKAEGYLVRSLVRQNKPKEALQEAESILRRKHAPHLLFTLALAASGDVKRLITFAEDRRDQRYLIEDAYRDEDLGPFLRSDAFRAFRERFPEPPAEIRP